MTNISSYISYFSVRVNGEVIVKGLANFWYRANVIVPLRNFCKIFELDGLNKAASVLMVSQPTLTRQMQALEQTLGAKLFFKSTGGKIMPTADGKILYSLVKQRVQSMDSIYEFFKKRQGEHYNKTISIVAHHTIITYILPLCIEKFRHTYNDNETEFILDNDLNLESALAKLDAGEADFVVYPTQSDLDRQYRVDDIITCEPIILMHQDNPLAQKDNNAITFTDLAKQNFIFIDQKAILGPFLDICREYNIGGNIHFIHSDWETVKIFVKFNLGSHLYSNIYDKFTCFRDTELISKNVKHLFPSIVARIITKDGAIFSEKKDRFLQILSNVKRDFINKVGV